MRRLMKQLACLAVLASVAIAQAPAEDATARCRVLIEELLTARDRGAARKTVSAILALDLDLAAVTGLLRGPRMRAATTAGTTERRLKLGPEGETFDVLTYVPALEEGDGPVPLWITLHGTGGRARQPFAQMLPFAREHGFVLASLEEHPSRHGRGWGYSDVERDVHADLVRKLASELPIDLDRVLVNGWSRGGHGSWDLALRYPDLFAGIGPIIGAVPQRSFSLIPSLRGVRVDAVNGGRDQPLLVEGAKEGVRRMSERGYDVRHFLDPRRGHEGFADRIAPMVEHLLDGARDPRPESVTLATWRKDVNRAYWISVKKFASKGLYEPGKRIVVKGSSGMSEAEKRRAWLAHIEKGTALVEATIESRGRVVVTARLVKSLELRLHPELLDLDGRIEVVVNGKVRKITPRPSVRTLLETAWESRDPELAAPARVTVSVR